MNNKLKRIIKKVRLKTILLLAITIASNSFAWFIYTTEVKTNMDTRVREWKVTFDSNGEHVEKVITLNVKELYPGMKSYTETLTASNTGESKAKIDFEIKDRSPINCRESPKFSKYFNTLWKELGVDE